MTSPNEKEIARLKAEIERLNDNATDDMRVIAMLLEENKRLRTQQLTSPTQGPAS